jgi:hypothetical protein
MEVDINIELVHHQTDIICPRSRDGRNLLGLLLTLGTGVAFGLVLAVCFLEGQSAGAASVMAELSGSSLIKQNAAPENESVRPFQAIVQTKTWSKLFANWRPVVTRSPSTD